MRVFYTGFNRYRQFPTNESIVQTFDNHLIPGLEDFEVCGAKTEILNFENAKQVACNENFVVILAQNGDLFKAGDVIEKVPRFWESNDHIVKIAVGSKICLALTHNGSLYNVPNKLDFRHGDVIDLKAGREHCLLLDKLGNVYSLGRGSRGQLGHGSLDDEMEPRLIEALAGLKMVAIATGGWHSCAVSNEGDLYVWGWNCNGQLGFSEVAALATPRALDLDFNVIQVACGSKHTVVLTDEGKLFGCGWNKYKQLGKDVEEDCYKFVFLKDFSMFDVKRVKCGPWNTIVLCGD